MACGGAVTGKPYVSHPWTDCDYEDEYDCHERAVFGIQEVEAATGKFLGDDCGSCVAHVGEMCTTDEWRGGQWRVWTL